MGSATRRMRGFRPNWSDFDVVKPLLDDVLKFAGVQRAGRSPKEFRCRCPLLRWGSDEHPDGSVIGRSHHGAWLVDFAALSDPVLVPLRVRMAVGRCECSGPTLQHLGSRPSESGHERPVTAHDRAGPELPPVAWCQCTASGRACGVGVRARRNGSARHSTMPGRPFRWDSCSACP